MIARIARTGLLVSTLVGLGVFLVAQAPALRASSGRAEVSRVRAYVVGSHADPTFPVSGGDTLIRLVTNALVPADVGGLDVDYAIDVAIQRPGEATERRVIHLRSHRSGPLHGTADPSFDAAGTPIADARHVDLVLDPPAPPGTLLTVRKEGDVPTLLRAWSSQPREAIERAQRVLALYPELRERLGDSIGIGAWDHLREDERRALTERHFARLAATGSPGVGYEPKDFYTRDVPPVEDEALGPALDLSRPVTWLLQGPADVSVHFGLTAGAPGTTLHLRRVAADTEDLATWTVDVAHPHGDWSGTVPAGPQTLVLVADAATSGNAEVLAPASALLPPDPLRTSEVSLLPASTTLRTQPIGPAKGAAFDAELPADGELHTLEIEAWGTAEADPVLTLTLTARSGTTVETVPTRLVANAYDAWEDDAGALHPVRGPARVKLLLPADAVRVDVTADTAALVRFRVPFHPEDEADDGAAPPTLRAIGASDGPASRAWVRGLDATEEVLVRVLGRVEPLPAPVPPPPTWLAQTLSPRGLAQRFAALERVVGVVTGKVLTEILPGRALHVRTSDTGRTVARWSYEVEDMTLLGSSLPLRVDGEDAGTVRLSLSRGTFRIPPLPPGDHTLAAEPPPGLRLFVNLPAGPGDPAPTYRARSVWQVTSAGFDLAVRVAGAGPRAVNLVVYDPSPGAREDAHLVASLDGGHPRRRSHGAYTRSTPARRTWALPPSDAPEAAHLVDGDRTAIGYARTLSFPLGDDLTPGAHVLHVTADRPTYARFFVVAPPGLPQTDEAISFDAETPDG